MANEIDNAVPESPPVVAAPGSVPVAAEPRRRSGPWARLFDWVLIRDALEQARLDEALVAPERVAMITPSSGVKPMLVSIDRPSSTAVTEQPTPR